jgi:hypothetical protein
MKMLRISKLPERMPKRPALIRTSAMAYDIWTGRSFFGSVYKHGRWWIVNTLGSCEESLRFFNDARAEAEHRAIRAEGRR